MFELIYSREVLLGGRLGPALNDTLVALAEGALEIQQRDHQAQRHAWAPCGRKPGADQLLDAAKLIRLIDNLASANLLGKEV